ncbi:MAG TPA: PIN domain-containing protein [Trebonia sp.]|nr:PIN domain-containing protein [Trebonia sp.]
MARSARRGVGPTVVLDARGLVRLAAGDPIVREYVRQAHARDGEVVTAASTLAEVLRGGPGDASVHQALKHVTVVPIDYHLARQAGALLAPASDRDAAPAAGGRADAGHSAAGHSAAGHAGTQGSLLAAVALRQPRPVVLLTADQGSMMRLTGEPHRREADRVVVIGI